MPHVSDLFDMSHTDAGALCVPCRIPDKLAIMNVIAEEEREAAT